MLPCGVYNERYAQDMAIVRTKRHWAILILAIFFLYLFPLFNLQYFISLINYLCITIIIVLGLQIV
ncbi:MAG: branched-chain amino acid ABC transporter permease, partial [Syntrophaceae bacterium]|nr:branched-chain amino acid ABC transporter permease [Syntrophaceae bacterium]